MKWVLTFVLALGLTTVAACEIVRPLAQTGGVALVNQLEASGDITAEQAVELRAMAESGNVDFWAVLQIILGSVGVSVPVALGAVYKWRGSPNNRKGSAPSTS